MINLLRFRSRLVEGLQVTKGANFHDAEDAVGEVLLDLWKKALARKLTFRAPGLYKSLLYACRNRYWRIRRSRKENEQLSRAKKAERSNRFKKRLPALLVMSDAGIDNIDSACPAVPDTASKQEQLRLLDFFAARTLTRQERIALYARRENFNYRQVAEVAGTTTGAARQACGKAIKKIRTALGMAAQMIPNRDGSENTPGLEPGMHEVMFLPPLRIAIGLKRETQLRPRRSA